MDPLAAAESGWRVVFAWLLLGCLAAVGALVVAECAARLFLQYGKRYFVHWPKRTTLLQIEPTVSPHLEPRVRIETNSFGERGSEPAGDSAGRLRIAVVGGSAAECYFLDQPSSWPERIAAYLLEGDVASRLGRSAIHVGNLGKSELTSGGARLIVDRLLSTWNDLDAVVLMIGISDMTRWLRFGAPGRLAAQGASEVFAIHPEGPYSWRPRAMALAELARRWKSRWGRWRTPLICRRNVGRHVLAMRSMKQNATKVIAEVPDSTDMLAEYRRHLSAIVNDVLAKRLLVIVLGQPHFRSTGCSESEVSQFWHGGIGDPARGPITVFFSDGVIDELARDVTMTTRLVAEEFGVCYLDLDAIVPSDLKHYYDQFHLTPAGADVVARAVATVLATELANRQTPV